MKRNRLSAWRRLARQGKPVLSAAGVTDAPTAFATLVLCEPEPLRAMQARSQPGNCPRLVFGDVAIEPAGDTPSTRIAEIVHALGAPSC